MVRDERRPFVWKSDTVNLDFEGCNTICNAIISSSRLTVPGLTFEELGTKESATEAGKVKHFVLQNRNVAEVVEGLVSCKTYVGGVGCATDSIKRGWLVEFPKGTGNKIILVATRTDGCASVDNE